MAKSGKQLFERLIIDAEVFALIGAPERFIFDKQNNHVNIQQVRRQCDRARKFEKSTKTKCNKPTAIGIRQFFHTFNLVEFFRHFRFILRTHTILATELFSFNSFLKDQDETTPRRKTTTRT